MGQTGSGNGIKIGTAEITLETAVERIGTTGSLILLHIVHPSALRQDVGLDNAVGSTELEEIHPVEILHEVLLGEYPGC